MRSFSVRANSRERTPEIEAMPRSQHTLELKAAESIAVQTGASDVIKSSQVSFLVMLSLT